MNEDAGEEENQAISNPPNQIGGWTLPDFEHWLSKFVWTPIQAAQLSTNVNPDYENLIPGYADPTAVIRLEEINAAIQIGRLQPKITPAKFLEFAKERGYALPPGLTADRNELKIDPRHEASDALLIVGLALHYGATPKMFQSDASEAEKTALGRICRQIETDQREFNIGLTSKTVLKRLNAAFALVKNKRGLSPAPSPSPKMGLPKLTK